ncbi:MAG TPA: hypothetical protein VFR78_02615, partial [Pyrinomonadaceae bacterium]|nr:hypothetical protein [Pyrinomonadaceae bacterium]
TDEKVKHMFDGFEEVKQLTIQTREDLAELTSLTTEGVRILYENSRNTDAKIAALVKAQIETEEMLGDTNAKLADTNATLRDTNARLADTLADTNATLRDTNARLADTNATLRDTNATVRNIGVKFDRHLKEDHNSG